MEMKEMKTKIFGYLQKAGSVLALVLIFALGYICSDVYHRIKKNQCAKTEATSPKITKKIDKVSVAINERNELMIIDREDGSYEIYQDSIGRCIFNLYANAIQTKYVNP